MHQRRNVLQIFVNADLAAHALPTTETSFRFLDHLGHFVRVAHQTATDAFFDGPRLRTAAVEINSVDPRGDHFRSTSKFCWIIRCELSNEGSLARVGAEV